MVDMSATTRRITRLFDFPVGNPDYGAEQEVELTADVDLTKDDSLAAVTFIEPTLRNLTDYYRESAIDRAMVYLAEEAHREQDREDEAARRAKALVDDFLDTTRMMNRVALATRMCGGSTLDAQLDALDAAIARVAP